MLIFNSHVQLNPGIKNFEVKSQPQNFYHKNFKIYLTSEIRALEIFQLYGTTLGGVSRTHPHAVFSIHTHSSTLTIIAKTQRRDKNQ